MQVGIFAKTFSGNNATDVLNAVRAAGYGCTQFNMACVGLPTMPDAIPDTIVAAIGDAGKESGVILSALSATYNMIHPDRAERDTGMRRLAVVADAARALRIPLVTLCTGTRDPHDQWRHHPDNAQPEAWADLTLEMERALAIAEAAGVDLGIEPEQANVVTSVRRACASCSIRPICSSGRRGTKPGKSWPTPSTSRAGRSPWPTPRTATRRVGSWQPARESSIFRILWHGCGQSVSTGRWSRMA
jgi:hypothetical protein